jgi:malate dehydrogenase (oxaloacetate-decarboxylating)
MRTASPTDPTVPPAPATSGPVATTAAAVTGPPPAVTFTEQEVLDAHLGGKLAVTLTRPLETTRDLSIVYTPGVAQVCQLIAREPAAARTHTWASRLVAVVSDGTAVLGLGDIGPKAALPVMEGKSALFKRFAGLNSVPIVLDTTDPEEIVEAVAAVAPSFGGINLEDISAPRCFEVERRLVERLDIPVMHDDQHGTAVVVLAALNNAVAVLGRDLTAQRVVVVGAGAAGVACTRILLAAGVTDVVLVDSRGIVSAQRGDLSPVKAEMAAVTNPRGRRGALADALRGADVLIGVSGGRIDPELLADMAPGPVVLALANPTPEIEPGVAARWASIVATGRSDHPNQINNVLAFPGIFLGALDSGARRITEGMKVAAASAISAAVARPRPEEVVPGPFTPGLAEQVAAAVAAAAVADGVAPRSV